MTTAQVPYLKLLDEFSALAVAIRTAGIAAGLVSDSAPQLTVAQLATLCEDLAKPRPLPAWVYDQEAQPVAYRWRFLPGGAWEMGAQRPWFTDRPGYQVQALGVIEE